MLTLKHYFRGDTLIEVTIAIGIFTLVAISVVAVVNISTSGAQSALETTLTREEIDAQAEALRFIQSAFYEDNKDKLNVQGSTNYENTKEYLYRAIWERIIDGIKIGGNNSFGVDESVSEFEPKTCSDIYDDKDKLISQGAFILNLQKLNEYQDGDNIETLAEETVVRMDRNNQGLFQPATTYPQLEYNDDNTLKSAQGIYIVGVKDTTGTNTVSQDGVSSESAYYDFYIRSCWYNSGSENLSKISTSVRLRDPGAIGYINVQQENNPSYENEEAITFDGWRPYGDNQYTGYVNYCKGEGPTLGQLGSDYRVNCEPIKGQHIITNGDDITLIGSTASAVDLGVYYDEFNIDAPFSIRLEIDASNVSAHPNREDDGLRVSMDIVGDPPADSEMGERGNQNIVVPGVQAQILQSSKSVIIEGTSKRIDTKASKLTLLLEYSRAGSKAKFKACITEPGANEECISDDKEIGDGKYLRVDYNFKSSAHACNSIGVIKLFDVEMSHSTHGNITFDI